MASNRGGARQGAGRKKGKVSQAKRDMAELAKDHAEAAFNTLTAIHADSQAPHAARVSAAVAILDRAYGKPSQSVAVSNPDGSAIGPTVIQIVAAKHDNGDDPTT